MSPAELAEYWGYRTETHYVDTLDGFTLQLVRVLPSSSSSSSGLPVVLQHGLLDAASTWVINLPDESLALILASKGYDVWMPNSRGNTYSPPKHWQFSFDDMAQYDLPATVHYITTHTNYSHVNYIGHSQGTTIAFAALAQDQQFADKINLFIALAPVAYVHHQS
jgi:lysosomal acid lipase/cholesteryl ester hydrolase